MAGRVRGLYSLLREAGGLRDQNIRWGEGSGDDDERWRHFVNAKCTKRLEGMAVEGRYLYSYGPHHTTDVESGVCSVV